MRNAAVLVLLALLGTACGGGGSPDDTPTDACEGSGLINDPTAPPACAVPDPFAASNCASGAFLSIQPFSDRGSMPGWWEGEIAAASDPDPDREMYFVATINAVTAPNTSNAAPRCVTEKGITVYRSDGGATWQVVPGNDKLPRPNAVTDTPLDPSDPFSAGVLATDPWLDVGRDGTLFLSLIAAVGAPDCDTPWPFIGNGPAKAAQDDLSTPEDEASRLEEVQLWMLGPESGAELTKLVLDPNGATSVDGQLVSQISENTGSVALDHPRMAANPARDQVVVSFLRDTGTDRLRTITKRGDVWELDDTAIDDLPGTGFSFTQMAFDPDGNLYVAHVGTSGVRVAKYAWVSDDWSLVQDVNTGLPPGTTSASAIWDLPNGVTLPRDRTPGIVIDKLGNASQAIVYIAFTVVDAGGIPRVALTAANTTNISTWLTPFVVPDTAAAFSPSLDFSGDANVVDVLYHELDPTLADPVISMKMRRFWASNLGQPLTDAISIGTPIATSEIPARRPALSNPFVFYGEYQGLSTKGRVAIAGVPHRVASGDTDLRIATINDRCDGTVREISTGSHPDHVWECDCSCGGDLTNLVGCVSGSISDPATACAQICQGSDCGASLSCDLGRQCTSTGAGRVKLGNGCQSTYAPWIGPPPSLFADFYATAISGSHANFELDGHGASTGLGGSVSFSVSTSPPTAGAGIEISRWELRPSRFHAGGFLGATIRDISIAHVERFYGTFVDDQRFVIPAHTAELVARLKVDPDGPSWLTGDTETHRLAIDNDAPIEGILDLGAGTVTLSIDASGGSDSVNATFVGELTAAPIDSDGDGVVDALDNCPDLYNPDQVDDPPDFMTVEDQLVTRCDPNDEIGFQAPQATDACTPDQVDVEGVVVSVDGQELADPVVLDDLSEYFPAGTLEIEWTATDGNANTSTITQFVEVSDVPTLRALNQLKIRDRVSVVAQGSAYGTLVSSGSARTELGVESLSGDVLSLSQVLLQDRAAVHGALKSPIVPEQQSDVTIDGPLLVPFTPFIPEFPSFVAAFEPTTSDFFLEPEASPALLAPGRYRHVKIERDARLELEAGRYEVDIWQMEPDSRVVLMAGEGAVEIAIKDQLIQRGVFVDSTGATSEPTILYDGMAPLYLDAPFAGVVVAPRAKLNISTVPNTTFTGVFSAQDIEVHPDTVVEHHAFGCEQTALPCSETNCEPAAPPAGGLQASVSFSTDWGNGYCAALNVANLGSAAITDWQVTVDFNGSTSYTTWNGSFSGVTGVVSVQPNMTWNRTIEPGASDSSIGWCANRTSPGSGTTPFVVSVP